MTARVSTLLAAAMVTVAHVANAQPLPAPAPGGPMIVERVENGFAVEPEVKITDFDGAARTLLGVSGGWVFDNRLLIGAGGDWLVNGGRGRGLGYGGLVVKWLEWADRPVGLSLRGLIGGGRATLTDRVTYYTVLGRNRVPTPVTATVRIARDVFVAEPQADFTINFGPRARLIAGAGYRFVANDRGFDQPGIDRRLEGATGTIGFQLGGSRTIRQ